MFLRCVMLAVLACMCISFNARGQSLDAAARLWRPPAPNTGTPVRIDGRQFVVNASIDHGYYWILSDAMVAPPPLLSVSVQAADGKWLPEKLVATNVTLLSGNRPIWKSVLEYAVFFRPIWLPPGGYGQYQASGVPLLREGTSIIARIELRSARGTARVDTPLRYPRFQAFPWASDAATP